MQKKQLVRHTHFIGAPVSLDLEDLVNDCRDWMSNNFACKSGHGTPPHITLLAPFSLPRGFSDGDVFETAAVAFSECFQKNVIPFAAEISGFGAFAERTLFLNVMDSKNWQDAHSIFAKKFSANILSQVKKSARKFFPHLTIANRDIPPGTMDEALRHFSELDFKSKFDLNVICVYARNSNGGWIEARRFCI